MSLLCVFFFFLINYKKQTQTFITGKWETVCVFGVSGGMRSHGFWPREVRCDEAKPEFIRLWLDAEHVRRAAQASVGQCVQSQRCGVLLGPQTKVLDAGGLAVEASRKAARCCLQQRTVPHLLCLRQGLIVRLAGQRTQWGRHVHVHTQVGQRGRGADVKGRIVHQVVGGGHVLAKLLLQAEEAEGRRSVGVALC